MCIPVIAQGSPNLTIHSHGETIPVFHPEFGRFMLEATPGKPWGIGFKDLLDVEHNMKWRSVNMSELVPRHANTDFWKANYCERSHED